MFNGSNCDRKSQLSGTWTEPLNLRARYGSNLRQVYFKYELSPCHKLKYPYIFET